MNKIRKKISGGSGGKKYGSDLHFDHEYKNIKNTLKNETCHLFSA